MGGLLVLALASPGLVHADTTVSTILVVDEAVPLRDQTQVHMGVRRGLRSLDGLDYVFSETLLTQRDIPDTLLQAMEAFPQVRETVLHGDPQAAREPLAEILATFEDNLALMSRSDLAEAYLLQALTYCLANEIDVCRRGFAWVLGFRETIRYPRDFPPAYLEMFEETQMALLTDGPRGSLTVETDPPGAEVFIDGRSAGPSPAAVESVLQGGHYITVKSPGYLEHVERVLVRRNRETRASIELRPSSSYLLVQQNKPRIRAELGRQQGGRAIRGIDGYLPVNQVVVGVVEAVAEAPPAGGDTSAADPVPESWAVALYLYDLRTNFLLAHREARVDAGTDQLTATAKRLAEELYDGVSLEGRVSAPASSNPEGAEEEVWEQWWFWTAIGAAVVSGTVTAIVLAPGDPEIPEGQIRLQGTVR